MWVVGQLAWVGGSVEELGPALMVVTPSRCVVLLEVMALSAGVHGPLGDEAHRPEEGRRVLSSEAIVC